MGQRGTVAEGFGDLDGGPVARCCPCYYIDSIRLGDFNRTPVEILSDVISSYVALFLGRGNGGG